MIELTSIKQLENAIERARQGKLFVQPTTLTRQYRVTNRENNRQYTVDFFLRNRKRFGHCSCKGGQSHRACKHLAAALGLHLHMASVKMGH